MKKRRQIKLTHNECVAIVGAFCGFDEAQILRWTEMCGLADFKKPDDVNVVLKSAKAKFNSISLGHMISIITAENVAIWEKRTLAAMVKALFKQFN